jgi:hypothetical protein
VSGSALSHRRSPLLKRPGIDATPSSTAFWIVVGVSYVLEASHSSLYQLRSVGVVLLLSYCFFSSSFVALETLLFIGTSCIAIFCKMALVVFAVSIFYHDDQRWVDWLVDQDGNVIYGGHVIVRSDG